MLGVDYGASRTGLALSDPVGVSCRPIGVLTERKVDKVVEAILTAVRGHDVHGIVVGLPRPLAGGTNDQMRDVLDFVNRLKVESPVPVETWDERFTTSLAERGRKHANAPDAVAACYMLQNYLDMLSNRG